MPRGLQKSTSMRDAGVGRSPCPVGVGDKDAGTEVAGGWSLVFKPSPHYPKSVGWRERRESS